MDGAAAVVLARGDVAVTCCEKPAFIAAIEHRVDVHSPGARCLATSGSTTLAARAAGIADGPVDMLCSGLHRGAELAALRAAIIAAGLASPPDIAAVPYTPMVSGLSAIGRAAAAIHTGASGRVVAHATAGPAMQQNLICVLDAGEAADG